ncbi:MAG: bifunctional diaminohydroxyphosphoribosylaminopyrimidine deaminase/5-amino-6-(5-phosphoribosylamino)uracil reductase RibD [Candidatus Omnitrophica bacterium]|nr:bifunctional diaminohydroxyphosphoribosylaminopyrimidine deaminase/5-amino-6-(5-phosphoribosylamino)uracil reductase RibD [Candidatus Omnitrophota bacterium]
MKRALQLAEKGRGWASPNPVAGVCLVKNNHLISEGFHAAFGKPHAETEAIRKAGSHAKGATMYVTLEPCSTYGKTPPCTEAISKARINRVVVGAIDPNPKHQGRGISILKKHGIRVQTGVLRKEVEIQNEAFFKWIRTGFPFVILKMAQSLDGKIASRTGESRWISGSEAREWVHHLRASVDAILVGKNTVLKDDPRLTVRNGRKIKEPWRIILDTKGEVSIQARVFKSSGPIMLVCSEKAFECVLKKFRRTKVMLLPLRIRDGKLDLTQLLQKLGALGITSLLVEGGGEVAWSFLRSKLMDKIEWVIAPKIIGGREAITSVEGKGFVSLSRALPIYSTRMVKLGEDFLLEGYLHHVFRNR